MLRRFTPQPDTGSVNSSPALHSDESQAIRKVVFGIEQAILLRRVRAATGGAQAALSLIEAHHLIAEGSGAVGIAALRSRSVDATLPTVAIVSGGNLDIEELRRLISSQ